MINKKGAINKNKKRVFIGLLSVSVLLILGMIIAGILIYYNRFGDWYRYILLAIITFLSLFIVIVSLGLTAVIMTLWHFKTFYGFEKLMNASLNLLFPLALVIGKIVHIPKEIIESSYIEVNNKLLQSRCYNIKPERILILAPHCLQRWDCSFKVTADISNCRHCGRCDIDNLSNLSDKYGIKLAVVTGGTLARKMVIDHKPKAIIAIACERDLTEGILDTNPIPVMGVLNIRPEGPCKNTKVDLTKVTQAIEFFLYGRSFEAIGKSKEVGNQYIDKDSGRSL
ncbi:MAG: DUF116 domain-containing protein [Tepidanaerobacteraceae bacterium]|jgi:hypothetical protein|nr:DUF116 domain-containing protein [Thermoanaerobacterales bacterium]